MPGRASHSAIKRDPDRFLEISLHATAMRLANDALGIVEAAQQLRELAGGRTDLLAIAAGGHLGAYLSSPGTHVPRTILAAAYLVEAAGTSDDIRRIPMLVDDARGVTAPWT